MKFFIFLIIIGLFSGCSLKDTSTKEKISQKAEEKKEPEQISSFITEILDTTPERVNNLIICAKTVDGTVILPDEEFSFNTVVGERTYEKGYREAKILIDGMPEYGIGGGICQISSTIYNSALFAGMEITERHDHEGDVLYIEKGHDAAVCYQTQDLKFINSLSFPVKLSVKVSDGQVYAVFYKWDV